MLLESLCVVQICLFFFFYIESKKNVPGGKNKQKMANNCGPLAA